MRVSPLFLFLSLIVGIFWTASNVAVVSATGGGCITPPSGLVSWWPGDGNADDISDGNPGTLQGGATFASGKVGQAFSFDGIDDRILIPDASNLNFGTGSFTVDAWVKADTFNFFNTVASKRAEPTGDFTGWWLGRAPDPRVWHVEVVSGGRDVVIDLFSDTPAVTGQFVHLAFVIDRTTNTLRLYVDGVLQSNQPSIVTLGSLTNSQPVRIGAAEFRAALAPFENTAFDGLIDEVEIYSRALTDTEIQAIFNAGSAGKCKSQCAPAPSGIVSWWPGNGNADDISDGNPGTLEGGMTFASGKVGQAFSFDGIDDRVFVGAPANLDIGGNSITLDAWVNPRTQGMTQQIVGRVHGDVGPHYTYLIRVEASGKVGFWIRTPPKTDSIFVDFNVISSSVIPLNAWTHVAGVYDGTQVLVYVNGIMENSAPATGAIMASSTIAVAIGKTHSGGSADSGARGDPFNGLIDEVEIFNVALSQSQIQTIFSASSAGKCTPQPHFSINVTTSGLPATSSFDVFSSIAPQSCSPGCTMQPGGTIVTLRFQAADSPSIYTTALVDDGQPTRYRRTTDSISITSANAGQTLTFNYQTQHFLRVVSECITPTAIVLCDTPGGEDYYNAGETAYATLQMGLQLIDGTAYGFIGWSGDATGLDLLSDGILMNTPKTAVARWEAGEAYGDVRTIGFWKHQLNVWYFTDLKNGVCGNQNIKGIGTAQVTRDALLDFLKYIDTTSSYFGDVGGKPLWVEGNVCQTWQNAYSILKTPTGPNSMMMRAEQQLLAVWLNLAKNAFFWNTQLSQDTLYVYYQYTFDSNSGLANIGEAIRWSEQQLLGNANFEAVKNVCDSINNGLGILWGT